MAQLAPEPEKSFRYASILNEFPLFFLSKYMKVNMALKLKPLIPRASRSERRSLNAELDQVNPDLGKGLRSQAGEMEVPGRV